LTDKAKRQKAHRRGHRAETLAAFALWLKGYKIIARRYKTPVGEVDLIVRKRNVVVFVEVKARATEQGALDAVSYGAQKRISAAGDWWLSKQPDFGQLSWRYDVVAMQPWKWPTHFTNVW